MNEIVKQKSLRETGNQNCTFEVSVKFLQNATWQGQIHWIEKDQSQSFRSVDEALTESGEEKKE
jgi:hypothetical protein